VLLPSISASPLNLMVNYLQLLSISTFLHMHMHIASIQSFVINECPATFLLRCAFILFNSQLTVVILLGSVVLYNILGDR
jgi:hypothetical protein